MHANPDSVPDSALSSPGIAAPIIDPDELVGVSDSTGTDEDWFNIVQIQFQVALSASQIWMALTGLPLNQEQRIQL